MGAKTIERVDTLRQQLVTLIGARYLVGLGVIEATVDYVARYAKRLHPRGGGPAQVVRHCIIACSLNLRDGVVCKAI